MENSSSKKIEESEEIEKGKEKLNRLVFLGKL